MTDDRTQGRVASTRRSHGQHLAGRPGGYLVWPLVRQAERGCAGPRWINCADAALLDREGDPDGVTHRGCTA